MIDSAAHFSWIFLFAIVILGLLAEGICRAFGLGFVVRCILFVIIFAGCDTVFN